MLECNGWLGVARSSRIPHVVLAMDVPAVVEVIYCAKALTQVSTLKIQLCLP